MKGSLWDVPGHGRHAPIAGGAIEVEAIAKMGQRPADSLFWQGMLCRVIFDTEGMEATPACNSLASRGRTAGRPPTPEQCKPPSLRPDATPDSSGPAFVPPPAPVEIDGLPTQIDLNNYQQINAGLA